MLSADADPASLLRWAIDNAGSFVWVAVVVLVVLGNIAKRLFAGSGGGRAETGDAPAAPARPAAPAYAAAPAYQAAPAVAAHPQRSRHTARPPAQQDEPGRAFASERLLSYVEPDPRPRLAILDAFGDPASARTAVVLAEIIAPPVALR